MAHICFVCTANVCRSPMAEGIFKHKIMQSGRTDLTASSMGVRGLYNEPASEHAQIVCQEHGIDISAHRSQTITGDAMQEADLVLCMEKGHRKFMQTFFPWHRKRIYLLGAWPGRETRKSIIKDPMGGPIKGYRVTFDLLVKHIDRIWEEM